jgi:hypothetical protein
VAPDRDGCSGRSWEDDVVRDDEAERSAAIGACCGTSFSSPPCVFPLPSASVRLELLVRAVLLMTATEPATDARAAVRTRCGRRHRSGHGGASMSAYAPIPSSFPFFPFVAVRCLSPPAVLWRLRSVGRLLLRLLWPWMDSTQHSTHTAASMEELELDKHSLLRGVGPRQANSKGQSAADNQCATVTNTFSRPAGTRQAQRD